jgi:hypothetical protein
MSELRTQRSGASGAPPRTPLRCVRGSDRQGWLPGLLALCAGWLVCGTAHAQFPQPHLDQILPLGGSAGSQIVLDLSGRDLDDVKSLHFDHPGFKAELVKPNQFRVTIAANVPTGTHEVRAVGKHGISNSRLLVVSRGLKEIHEIEPNDTPDKAQAVPMNVAITGTSDNNGEDLFRFPAHQGERVTIECQAFRLDSLLRPVLHLTTLDGKELARSKPYFGRTDPFLDFVAPTTGDYLVRLHDITFAGDMPYRLIISNLPLLEYAFPPAIVPGARTELTVLGRNLPGGKPRSELVDGLPLQQLLVPFAAPSDPASVQRFTFIDHPASATLNSRGLQLWPHGLENPLQPVTLTFASAPTTLEREPNDTPESAQEITLPTVICGRLERPGDIDWYSFTAKASETIAVDLLCERLERPGDLFVLVTDARGKEIGALDDHGNNVNALMQFNRDPVGTISIPADGKYRLLVRDRTGKGGPRFIYALRIGKPEADFYPVIYHETTNDPTCPAVRRGGSAAYELCLNRRDGFNGPVTVEAEGLPRGVTCAPVGISPQTETASIVFTATLDAAEWAGPIRLKAWSMVDKRRVEREMCCAERRFGNGNGNPACRACRETCLAVRGKAPYSLKLPYAKLTVAAGGTLETKVTAQRYWPDFKGKIQLTGLNLPPNFDAGTVEIPEGKNEAPVKITVGGDVPPGTYTLFLRGDAQVSYQPDPAKPDKSDIRVADPTTALTVQVTSPKK